MTKKAGFFGSLPRAAAAAQPDPELSYCAPKELLDGGNSFLRSKNFVKGIGGCLRDEWFADFSVNSPAGRRRSQGPFFLVPGLFSAMLASTASTCEGKVLNLRRTGQFVVLFESWRASIRPLVRGREHRRRGGPTFVGE